jgi:hypothetical protein
MSHPNMFTPGDQGPTILDLLMDARYPQPSYAAQVAKAIQDKARILATSPYKNLGWNVVRRLECLRVIQEELESNNDPQLSNVKATISAYKRDGKDRLLWTPGPVSFWIQGTPVGDVPGPFNWNACLQLQRRAVGGGLWIEGVSNILGLFFFGASSDSDRLITRVRYLFGDSLRPRHFWHRYILLCFKWRWMHSNIMSNSLSHSSHRGSRRINSTEWTLVLNPKRVTSRRY